MKHQKQGYNECQLATFAMLADVPLAKVRLLAKKHLGGSDYKLFTVMCDWSKQRRFQWHIAMINIAAELGLPPGLHRNKDAPVLTRGRPDLSGKGQITIRWDDGGSHAMAYENEQIYDPNDNGPKSWEDWLKTSCPLYGAEIEAIQATPIPENWLSLASWSHSNTEGPTDPQNIAKSNPALNDGQFHSVADPAEKISDLIDNWLDEHPGELDCEKLCQLTQRIAQETQLLQQLIAPCYSRDLYPERPAIRLMCGCDGKPDVWLLVWRKQDQDREGTEIHDHARSCAGVRVFLGCVREKQFQLGAGNREDGFYTIERHLKEGQELRVETPYLHTVAACEEDIAVTIHAYYPPLNEMNLYRVEDGCLRCVENWRDEGGCKS